MLGRFTAGMLVIALYMLLSVKSIGVRETKRNEELIGFELEYLVEGAKLSGKITSKDYEALLDRRSFTG